jgi:hypothetical protein
LLRRHLGVELIAILATCPLIPHSGSKLHPPSVATGVKGDTTKLCSEGSLASLKMNLLVLIVHLIVLSEDIGSWTAPTGSDSPDKHTNMSDSIRRQMVQLHSKFAQDVHKNWMRWHTKPNSEKVFKDDSFIRSRLRDGLRARSSAISFGKIVCVILNRPNAGFCDI